MSFEPFTFIAGMAFFIFAAGMLYSLRYWK
jgi:hypothetical protein